MDDEDLDWLGDKLTATINRELDLIERRNGEGFTPTFERDLAFKVASLAFAAFSARGYTQGGTMIADELHQLIASDALQSLTAENAKLRAERDGAREAALEEAAKVADDLGGNRVERGPDGMPCAHAKHDQGSQTLNAMRVRASTIAVAIRNLKGPRHD